MTAWLTSLGRLLQRVARASRSRWTIVWAPTIRDCARHVASQLRTGWTMARRVPTPLAYRARRVMTWRPIALDLLRALSVLRARARMAWGLPIVGLLLRVRSASSAVALDLLAGLSALRRGLAMPKPLLALNVLLAGVSTVAFIWTARALLAPYPLPPSTVPRPPASAVSTTSERRPNPRPSASYDVIAARTLFHPDRAESTRKDLAVKGVPPQAPPVLYGVVINDDVRLAYLEDPTTKRLVGYKPGDEVAGGRIERIESDRVVIGRADGPLEVLLRGSSKPRPTESAAAATPLVVRRSRPE